MQAEPYFERAPIVEALLGIEIVQISDELIAEFRNANPFGADTPQKEEVNKTEFKIDLKEGSSTQQNRQLLGYRFSSSDLNRIVQFRTDGFYYSLLAPYTGWQSFAAEAQSLWELYSSLVGHLEVSKLVLRYINKFHLPVGPDIEQYLNIYPHFPVSQRITMRNYFFRIESVIDEPYEGTLTMQQGKLPEEKPEAITFLVDNEYSFPVTHVSNLAMWQTFGQVRILKNRLFNEMITPLTKELIS